MLVGVWVDFGPTNVPWQITRHVRRTNVTSDLSRPSCPVPATKRASTWSNLCRSFRNSRELRSSRRCVCVCVSSIVFDRTGIAAHSTQDEIASIIRKRADFEHTLNARGSRPADFAQYAEYEMNVEALRRKRVRRLGATVNPHSGRRRIFFVLDRATRKFHGDVSLWMQYADYARREKAHHKFVQIMTAVLRLHPTKPDLWIHAAKYAMEVQGDMMGGRTYLQRGLRFCPRSKDLWLEYAKLEMIYIGKLEGRRRILGIDQAPAETAIRPVIDGDEADTIALPDDEEEEEEEEGGESESGHDPAGSRNRWRAPPDLAQSSPALAGAIPRAVVDAALKQFPDEAFAARFFDVFADFIHLSCARTLLQHVLDAQLGLAPTATSTLSCSFRLPVLGVDRASADFPSALRVSLERLKMSLDRSASPASLAMTAADWLLSLVDRDDVDGGVRSALGLMLRKTLGRVYDVGGPADAEVDQVELASLEQRAVTAGLIDEADLSSHRTGPCRVTGLRSGGVPWLDDERTG